MKKAIGAIVGAVALALVLFGAGGAATHAQGGMSHTTVQGDVAVTQTYKPAITLDGNSMKLMATGSTSAWFMETSTLACGSYQVTWDDLGAGATWKQTGSSTWNATFNSNGSGGCGNYDVRVYHKGPSAGTPGVCGSDCVLSPGQTSSLGTDYTGTGTSVMTWDNIEGIGCTRFYLIPGSTDVVEYPEGSPCP